MVKTYYNEIEPFAVQWLKNLISAGEISPGTVDDRSIEDVTPTDLAGYERCHFFAGIAGWDYALKLAGWPENLPVWTGSCPCQPFSSAGKRGGGLDERHLWPFWYWLIRQCRPPVVFGEQVASKDGLKWLDVVFSDLEAAGYSCGAADLPACSVGAPHIRQRLWFVATLGNSDSWRFQRNGLQPLHGGRNNSGKESCFEGPGPTRGRSKRISPTRILADSSGERSQEQCRKRRKYERFTQDGISNPWQPLYWFPCRDGKWRPTGIVDNAKCWRSQSQDSRPTQPIIQPLAHGVPGRVGCLRAYGNAIVPQVAAQFIQAIMEIIL